MARRLTRQGLALSSGALAVVLSERAAAVVPASVVVPTIHAAILVAAGPGAATGFLSAQVLTLTDGVLKTMLLTKLKIAAVVCLTMVIVGGGAGGLLYPTQAAEGTKTVRGAVGVPMAAADKPTDDEKGQQETKLKRQLRALQVMQAELEKQLRALKDKERMEAIIKQLREQLQALEKQDNQRRLREAEAKEAILEELNKQLKSLDEKKLREELLKEARKALAKQEAITTAVREIEKALKKLRETTGDRKAEIEALGEIQKAVEAMKSAARDLTAAEVLHETLLKEVSRKKQP